MYHFVKYDSEQQQQQQLKAIDLSDICTKNGDAIYSHESTNSIIAKGNDSPMLKQNRKGKTSFILVNYSDNDNNNNNNKSSK
ncbi:hypothetical protein BLOT_005851 [Blomia tropicalis]|nr:hypothetical protein BLOT_005851 [Blomia tropicalis]